MKIKRAVLCLFLICATAALAQPPGPPQEGRSFERIQQWKKIRLIELLQMNEDQSVRFFARMNEHDTERREMMKKKSEMLDRVERLVRNRAEPAEFEKAIPDILAAEDQIRAEQRKFYLSLTDILTPERRAKLLLFERQFERELREAMREAQRRRGQKEGE
jgi:Spy/CpxP family protein refolding chaperone